MKIPSTLAAVKTLKAKENIAVNTMTSPIRISCGFTKCKISIVRVGKTDPTIVATAFVVAEMCLSE